MNTLKDLLYLQNPWWREENYLPLESKLPTREIFSDFFHDITSYRQIISLTGLRRTGKSTLLRQIVAKLLGQISPFRILYFSFEEPTVEENTTTISQIIDFYLQEIKGQKLHQLEETYYFFLDEIQLVPYWQNILKRYYDLSPYVKFIVTGSSSLFIRQNSHESLAGRIFEKKLPPLSFNEYQKFSLQKSFNEYLEFGGFPELISMESREKKIEYLKQWVIGKIIEIDIPKLTGIRRVFDLERLFWALVPNSGQIINFPNLAQDLGIKRPTLFKYLSILENSLLINPILNIAGSFRSPSRVLRKLYPATPNFLSLLPFSPVNIGMQAENYVASYLFNKYNNLGLYHLRQKEIDFILPEEKIAIEVKYQSIIHKQDYRFLTKYVSRKKYRGLIITKDYSEILEGGLIRCLPIEQLELKEF